MISSAVAANQIRAFEVSKDFIPLIRSESVLISNLVDVVTNRLSGNEKIRKLALETLGQISEDAEPMVVFTIFASRALKEGQGRHVLIKMLHRVAQKLKDKRPNFVIK